MQILILLLFLLPISNDGNWELKKNSDGIKVYMREIPGSSLKQIKVTMKCQGTLEKFRQVILNVDKQKEWVYNVEESWLIKKISSTELVYYSEYHLPWPASNRDVTAHLKLVTDSIPNTYFVRAHSVKGYIPEKAGKVRVPSSNSFWKIQQVAPGELDIEYIIRLDPGGSIPSWLINMTATTGPYNSFVNLKERLKH